MHIYYEDRDAFYNYLLSRSTEFRLSDMHTRMLRDLTKVQIFSNLAMSSVDRSKISMNLILTEDIEHGMRDMLQSIMGDTRLHSVRVNRYCYISSYVRHNRGACIAESEQLYNQIVEVLESNGIKYRFQIEISWGGTEDCIATTHFFPETMNCDWYSHECAYHPVSHEMFLQSLLAALIGAHGFVYYDKGYDKTAVLRYLMERGIYSDLKTIDEKVLKAAEPGIFI